MYYVRPLISSRNQIIFLLLTIFSAYTFYSLVVVTWKGDQVSGLRRTVLSASPHRCLFFLAEIINPPLALPPICLLLIFLSSSLPVRSLTQGHFCL